MEFIIVPQLILVVSLFGVLFVLGRNFSRFKETLKPTPNLSREGNLHASSPSQEGNAVEGVAERVKGEEEKFKYLFKRLVKRINLSNAREKYKRLAGFAHARLEKVLRKTRINFLKLDNKTFALIEKLRKKTEAVQAEDAEPTEKLSREQDRHRKDEARQKGNNPPLTPPKRGIKEVPSREGSEVEKNKKKSKEKEYLELIGNNPKNTDAYWKLGILYSRKRNYKDALNCFKEVVKIKPNYEKAKNKVKDISEKLGM